MLLNKEADRALSHPLICMPLCYCWSF